MGQYEVQRNNDSCMAFLIVWDKTGPVTMTGPIRPTSLIIYFWILVACTTFVIVRYIIKKYRTK